MKKLILCFLMLICGELTFATSNALLDTELPQHPRILLLKGEEKQLVEFIKSDSIWSLFQERTLQSCDRLLTMLPLDKIKIGKRLLATSREALYRIFMLSYAYRTTGEMKYAKRAEKEMLHIAGYDNWNPEHFLDVAEMTMGFSIGYDWLYDVLSPKNREIIRKAILNKGLRTSMDKRYNSFLEKTNNWNQVCNTAMAYGAMALMDTDQDLCRRIMERSIEKVRIPMANYGPDGAYPEGYGYWHYGTTYNVMLLAALETLYGDDFGLSSISGFIESGEYVLHMVGPTGLPFNFGDSGERMRLNTSIFWFARKTRNPSLLKNERNYLFELTNYDYEQYRRMLPSIFVLGNGIRLADLPQPEKTLFAAHNEAPVCLMRSSWRHDAIYVGMKGGRATANSHTHLDAGSFVMDAQDVRWAIDLGPQEYNTLELKGIGLWDNTQNSQRWKVYRYNNFAHNVFSINDELFNVEGRAELVDFKEHPNHKEATFDLTTLYNKINKAERCICLNEKSEVVIEDKIQNGNRKAEITWRMLTPAAVECVKGKFILRKDGKTLCVELPEGVTPFVTPAIPDTDYDQMNLNVSIIGYKVSIEPNMNQVLKVVLKPEQVTDKSYIRAIADKVASWQIKHQREVIHPELDWTNGAWYRGLAEWAMTTNNELFLIF